MRATCRGILCCLIPLFGIIGIPLLLHGGLNIPANLSRDEAMAAGTNQLQVLEEKKKNSEAYKEMLVGAGFTGVASALCGGSLFCLICCPHVAIEPEEKSEQNSTPDTTPKPAV